jgi:hypothetical protein
LIHFEEFHKLKQHLTAYETLENVPTAQKHVWKINGDNKLENLLHLTQVYLRLDNNITARHMTAYLKLLVSKFFSQRPLDLL